MSRWAWLVVVAFGCGHAAPAPPGHGTAAASGTPDAAVDAPLALEDDLPRLAERAVALYTDWKAALDEAGTDCAAAAARLNALADRNADVIAANHKLYRGSRAKVTKFRAELEKHQAELDAAAKAIAEAPAMTACSADDAFARALDRLGGEG